MIADLEQFLQDARDGFNNYKLRNKIEEYLKEHKEIISEKESVERQEHRRERKEMVEGKDVMWIVTANMREAYHEARRSNVSYDEFIDLLGSKYEKCYRFNGIHYNIAMLHNSPLNYLYSFINMDEVNKLQGEFNKLVNK